MLYFACGRGGYDKGYVEQSEKRSAVSAERNATARAASKLGWPLRLAYGVLLGVAAYRALDLLPAPLIELQRMGLIDAPPCSPQTIHLVVAVLAGVLYTLLPPLGGVLAVLAAVVPLAFLHLGLATVYLVLAMVCVPCLGKHEGLRMYLTISSRSRIAGSSRSLI